MIAAEHHTQRITLRPYQQEAVNAVYEFLRTRDENPCVVIPTAGGKTPVMATICRDAVQAWNGRVLVLAHVKELLEQAAEKLRMIAPDLPVGVYSAGLKRRDLGYAVTIAGIQSVHRRAKELGAFDLVLVDEAHLIPPGDSGGGDGMYRQFLADAKAVNPHLRVIGLTATPFRMKSGTICAPDHILHEICYEVGVKELIVKGYLCPLRTKAGRAKADTSELHVRAGEFVAGEVEDLMDEDGLVEAACAEVVAASRARQSVLIFASGIKHGRHICREIEERHGEECGFVCGESLPYERDELLGRFKRGDLKFLCNVNVLTTGFDAPNIDCVAMLRPTLSPGLYYQMVGRGFRLHPGKDDCLVLDFGGNVLRHGPVDAVQSDAPASNGTGDAPAKECPDCHELIHAAYAICPECGHAFPPPNRERHEATASSTGIISGQVTRTAERVIETTYAVHEKRDASPDAPRSMRVEYRIGFNRYISEWICFEHPQSSYARVKAEQWWRHRSRESVPDTAERAVLLAEEGVVAQTFSVTVAHKAGEKYDRIVDHELGAIPPPLSEEPAFITIPDDSIPF